MVEGNYWDQWFSDGFGGGQPMVTMVFDGCAPLVRRWNGSVPSSKSTWYYYIKFVIQIVIRFNHHPYNTRWQDNDFNLLGGRPRLSSCVHDQLWRRRGERWGEKQEDGKVTFIILTSLHKVIKVKIKVKVIMFIFIVMLRFALRSSQRKPRSPRLEPRGGQGGKPKVMRRMLGIFMITFSMMRTE